jgi:hypothetical protein
MFQPELLCAGWTWTSEYVMGSNMFALFDHYIYTSLWSGQQTDQYAEMVVY